MSIEASSLVWKHSQSKGAERLVMLCIANYINSDGLAWPSIETIHKDTQVSERQITRSIAKLESDGELQIIEKGDGRGRSTVYKITLKGDMVSPYEQPEKGDISSTKGDMVSEKGDTLSIKGDTMSPQSLEPLITNNNAAALMKHFTTLTGYDPPNDTTNAYRDRWERPITAFLRISNGDIEQAKTRIEYGLNVARGGNEQGKRYSWRDPEAIKTAALSWLPDSYNNGSSGKKREPADMLEGV